MYTYLFLQYLLLIFAIFAGYNISKNKHSKIWSIILIVLFTIVEGSRFGRGIDYNVYADAWVWEYAQPPLIFETFLFRLLCKLIFYTGLPYQTLIYLTSFILILGGIKFLKNFRMGLCYTLPIFVYLVYAGENMFRWYTAFGLWLLVLDSWIAKKYIMMFSYIICCLGMHVMFFPYMFLFFVIVQYKKILFKPLTAIIVFLVLALIWENSYMKHFSSVVSILLAQSNHYAGYADNASVWLTASNRDEVVYSIMNYLGMLLVHIPVICIGRKYVVQHINLLPFYNIYILAFALLPAMTKIELFARYNQIMIFYYCIFAGIMFATLTQKVNMTNISKFMIVLGVLSCLQQAKSFTTWYYLQSNKPWYTLFIWDAHGRESLDPRLLQD